MSPSNGSPISTRKRWRNTGEFSIARIRPLPAGILPRPIRTRSPAATTSLKKAVHCLKPEQKKNSIWPRSNLTAAGVVTKAEFPMRGVQRGLHFTLLDDKRDIAFGRALCNSDDVHVFPAQRIEGAACHAWRPAHVLSNDGHNGNVRIDGDVFHRLMRQIVRELFPKRLDRPLRVGRGYNEANVVLR